MKDIMDLADGVAGFAALINGLVLWPVVRSLKKTIDELKEKHSARSRRRPARRRKS